MKIIKMTLSVFLFELFELQPIQVARSCDHVKSCIKWLLMGGEISQEWYEFSTGDHEIYRYGRVYRLDIKNVDGCDRDYR